jgi:hypothetical protein
MENQTKQILAGELEKILLDWEDDPVCSPHRVHHAMASPMGKILERLYDLSEKLSTKNDDLISVLNAYTKRCYGQFTTEQKAKDYMGQMLLKEVGLQQYSETDWTDEDLGGSHCIWVFDARGVEGV